MSNVPDATELAPIAVAWVPLAMASAPNAELLMAPVAFRKIPTGSVIGDAIVVSGRIAFKCPYRLRCYRTQGRSQRDHARHTQDPG